MQGAQFENVPIATTTSQQSELLTHFVDYILLMSSQPNDSEIQAAIRYFERVIDALVYELYLPNELHAAQRFPQKVIGAVKLPQLTGNTNQDLQNILDLYNQLYDPQHEVRRLVHYLDSIPEVRLIEAKER